MDINNQRASIAGKMKRIQERVQEKVEKLGYKS